MSSLAGSVLAARGGRRAGDAADLPRPQPHRAAVRPVSAAARSASLTSCCSPATTRLRRPSRSQAGVRPRQRPARLARPRRCATRARLLSGERSTRRRLPDRRRREPVRAAPRFRADGWPRRWPPAREFVPDPVRVRRPTVRATGWPRSVDLGLTSAARCSPASGRSGRCGRLSSCAPGARRPRPRRVSTAAARRARRPGRRPRAWRCARRPSQALREIPGVAGVHVMAFGYERGVPEILERGGSAGSR